MSNINESDIGRDIIRYHKIITRAITTSHQHADASLKNGSLEESTKDGFLKYLQSFSSVLKAHHMSEDEVIFPYVQKLIPNVPYKRLTDEHEVLSDELDSINNAITIFSADENVDIFLTQLNSSLVKIYELWIPHIKIEESLIYERIGNMIDLEEMNRFRMEFIQFYQKHVGPDYLVVPFSLYNLQPDDRVSIEQNLPDVVKKKLIPIDWKDKWTPMKPFLLK
jgi:hemerythrin-like domain-containing protein